MGSTNNVLFSLKRAYLAVRRAMDTGLGDHHLTASQLEILAAIYHQDGIEHRALMEYMGITSPTLTSILDGMVERGWVERRISPEDARVKQLYITAQGHLLFESLESIGEEFLQHLLVGFTASESALLIEWLGRLAHNADEYCKPDSV